MSGKSWKGLRSRSEIGGWEFEAENYLRRDRTLVLYLSEL